MIFEHILVDIFQFWHGSLGVIVARELAHAFNPINKRLNERGRKMSQSDSKEAFSVDGLWSRVNGQKMTCFKEENSALENFALTAAQYSS